MVTFGGRRAPALRALPDETAPQGVWRPRSKLGEQAVLAVFPEAAVAWTVAWPATGGDGRFRRRRSVPAGRRTRSGGMWSTRPGRRPSPTCRALLARRGRARRVLHAANEGVAPGSVTRAVFEECGADPRGCPVSSARFRGPAAFELCSALSSRQWALAGFLTPLRHWRGALPRRWQHLANSTSIDRRHLNVRDWRPAGGKR